MGHCFKRKKSRRKLYLKGRYVEAYLIISKLVIADLIIYFADIHTHIYRCYVLHMKKETANRLEEVEIIKAFKSLWLEITYVIIRANFIL